MMLPRRSIPKTSLEVSAIALGTADWTTRQGDSLERVYSFYREQGGNCFDGAHCYAFWLDALGAPERALGKLVRKHDRREDVIICTKGCHPAGGPKYPRSEKFMSAEVLASDIRDSLERLSMDYIDLYYLHRDDPRIPVDEIMDAMHQQQQAGRIRYYAASNWRPPRLDEAAAYASKKGYTGFVASQILFNMAHPVKPLGGDMCSMDDQQERWYARSGMPVFAFSSTANGYFAKGPSAGGGYATDVSDGRRQRAIELGDKLGATPNAIALAYLMNRPCMVVPIVGSLKIDHLADACSAARLSLSETQMSYLRDGTAGSSQESL